MAERCWPIALSPSTKTAADRSSDGRRDPTVLAAAIVAPGPMTLIATSPPRREPARYGLSVRDDPPADPGRWVEPVILVVSSMLAAAFAWVTRPSIAADDAAISFRYAERLATGHGLTYNDGEHVLGASSVLHTALIAALRWFEIPTSSAAVALGIVGTAACAALVAHLGCRLAGPVSAAVAVVVFLATPVRFHAAAGLESATLVALSLATVAARHAGRDVLAGFALGAAVLAKLDAGSLAVAITVAALVVRRRLPIAVLAVATATVAPWYAWATVRYGSPLPNSFLAKIRGQADAPGYDYDPFWVVSRLKRFLPAAGAGLVVGLAGGRDRDPQRRETLLVLATWLMLATALAALVPLGAPYPWYLASSYGSLSVLAGVALATAGHKVTTWWSATATSHPSALARPVALGACCLVTLAFGFRSIVADATVHGLSPLERQWQDVRAAGHFVAGRYDGRLVASCLGWVGAAAPRVRITDPCRLTTNGPSRPPDAVILTVDRDRPLPPGMCELVRFDRAQRADASALAVVVAHSCR